MISQKMKNSKNKNDHAQNHAKNICLLGNTRLSLMEIKISYYTLEKIFQIICEILRRGCCGGLSRPTN